jgi:hypothetical protein
LSYPTLRLSSGIVVDNAIIFGGVKLSPGRVDRHGNAAIEKAKAIRLFYVLNQSKEADEWIRAFIQVKRGNFLIPILLIKLIFKMNIISPIFR